MQMAILYTAGSTNFSWPKSIASRGGWSIHFIVVVGRAINELLLDTFWKYDVFDSPAAKCCILPSCLLGADRILVVEMQITPITDRLNSRERLTRGDDGLRLALEWLLVGQRTSNNGQEAADELSSCVCDLVALVASGVRTFADLDDT